MCTMLLDYIWKFELSGDIPQTQSQFSRYFLHNALKVKQFLRSCEFQETHYALIKKLRQKTVAMNVHPIKVRL